jgi:hypothetical protein
MPELISEQETDFLKIRVVRPILTAEAIGTNVLHAGIARSASYPEDRRGPT